VTVGITIFGDLQRKLDRIRASHDELMGSWVKTAHSSRKRFWRFTDASIASTLAMRPLPSSTRALA
jgi:hypothetical protein